MRILKLKSDILYDSPLRIDASYHLSDGPLTKLLLEKSPYNMTTLGKASKIFSGKIFRRTFVSKRRHGWPYVTGSDIVKVNVETGKFISRKHTINADELRIHKDWILVTCSGTLGNVVYTNEDINGKIGTHDLIRIIPSNEDLLSGYIYAYLASKYGRGLLTQSSYGGVVKHIEPHHVEQIPIPILPDHLQNAIHDKVIKASVLKADANRMIKAAQIRLKNELGLGDLQIHEFESFGSHDKLRHISTFVRAVREVSPLTINAFNYSTRIEQIINRVKSIRHLPLEECLDNRKFFSTGSFKRVELEAQRSIRLINQSDIFDFHKKGKMLANKFVKSSKLVDYGEVIIAGVGTLGEAETFCRVIFGNEELSGQLISGEFIRMYSNKEIPSGYLYCWLSTDYGFRMIRSTQAGTKLCRPITELLKRIPVPLLGNDLMQRIDSDIREAHTKLFNAVKLEKDAMQFVENQIESWQS